MDALDAFVDTWLFDLAETVRVAADRLRVAETPFGVEVMWQLWDSLFEEERRQRAEWLMTKLAGETQDDQLRTELGDQYEVAIEAQHEEATRVIKRRAASLAEGTRPGTLVPEGHLNVSEVLAELRTDLRQAVAFAVESVQRRVELIVDFDLEDLGREAIETALRRDFRMLMLGAGPAFSRAFGELRESLTTEEEVVKRFLAGRPAPDP